jgi:hypothetical protein
MSKKIILKNPTRVTELSLDDLYDDFDDWGLKAQKVITKRERQLRDGDAW